MAKLETRIIFQSFHDDSFEKLAAEAPRYPRILLISDTMVEEESWGYWLTGQKKSATV